jgi:hypothetical protein
MDKFIVACMLFSFICGAFAVEMVETRREYDKGCVVKFTQGNVTHVSIGHTSDEY